MCRAFSLWGTNMATRKLATAPGSNVGEVLQEGENWAVDKTAGVDDDAEDFEQSPLDRVLIALETDADPAKRSRIALYRAEPAPAGKPPTWAWCIDYTAEDLEAGGLGMIRDRWGPGDYEIRVLGHKHGAKHFTRIVSSRVTLAQVPGDATVVRSAPQSDVTAVLSAIQENQRALLDALTQRPQSDPMQQFGVMLGLMTQMREAFGMNNAPQQPQKSSIAEVVDAIKEIKSVQSLIGGENEEKSDVDKLLGLAEPIMKMVGENVRGAPVPVLRAPATFVEHAAPMQNPIPRAEPQPNAQEQAPTESADQPEVSPEEEAVKNALIESLSTLVQMATEKKPIQEGADYVYEKLPDEMIEILGTSFWWTLLCAQAPQVQPYESWFKQVRDAALKMFEEGDAEEQEHADVSK